MTKPFGPHLIDFYDLPPRVEGNRIPRIIGKLTEAGAAIRDGLPEGIWHPYFENKNYKLTSASRSTIEFQSSPINLIVRSIGLKAKCEYSAASTSVLDIDIRKNVFGNNLKARASEWHLDNDRIQAQSVRFIIGDDNPQFNTEYATVIVPNDILPFSLERFAGSDEDYAVTNFLQNANAVAQIGSNEILEMFGDTPHRSSPHFAENKGGWRFLYYRFN